MDDEEALEMLRRLRAHLAEFGGSDAALARDAIPEDGAALGVREELSLLLDEYEAVLVQAPKMVSVTMRMLGARSISLTADPLDPRFVQFGTGVRRLVDGGGVEITYDALGEWVEIAERAGEVIGQLRGMLGGQQD